MAIPGLVPGPDATAGGAIIPGAPTDDTDREARKGRWREALTSPEFLATLTQTAVNLTQPRRRAQTPLGHVTSGIAGGLQAAGRVGEATRTEDIAERETVTRETEAGARVTGAEAAAEAARAQTMEAATRKRESEQKTPAEVDVLGAEAELKGAQAGAVTGEEAQRRSLEDLERQKAQAEIAYTNATTAAEKERTRLWADEIGARVTQARAALLGGEAAERRAQILGLESYSNIKLNEAQATALNASAKLREAQAEQVELGPLAPLGGTAQARQQLADAIYTFAQEDGVPISPAAAMLAAEELERLSPSDSEAEFMQKFELKSLEKGFGETTREQAANWAKLARGLYRDSVSGASKAGALAPTYDNVAADFAARNAPYAKVGYTVSREQAPDGGYFILDPNGAKMEDPAIPGQFRTTGAPPIQ